MTSVRSLYLESVTVSHDYSMPAITSIFLGGSRCDSVTVWQCDCVTVLQCNSVPWLIFHSVTNMPVNMSIRPALLDVTDVNTYREIPLSSDETLHFSSSSIGGLFGFLASCSSSISGLHEEEKNPTYGRQSISRPMWIVALITKKSC